MRKTKILFLAANPVEMRRLTLDEEFRKIRERLDESPSVNNIELVEKWAVRPGDWLKVLNDQQHFYAVVHFSGHGTRGGMLQHTGSDGTAQPVSLQTLTEVFRVLNGDICLVVLNACYSSQQAQVLVEVADCVISMNGSIHDEIAITFIDELYRALFAGKSIQNAFEQGKLALKLRELNANQVPEPKWDQVPELLVRPGIDATKVTLMASFPQLQRSKAFIGFHPKDKRFLNELHPHLQYYRQKGTIDYWDATMLLPGAKWKEVTRENLAMARVAILLVSPDLLASTFMTQELPSLLKEAERGEITIFCVLLRPCSAINEPDLTQLVWFNNRQPLSGTNQRKRDEVWKEVAMLVQDILQT
jgi:hypothetical protein